MLMFLWFTCIPQLILTFLIQFILIPVYTMPLYIPLFTLSKRKVRKTWINKEGAVKYARRVTCNLSTWHVYFMRCYLHCVSEVGNIKAADETIRNAIPTNQLFFLCNEFMHTFYGFGMKDVHTEDRGCRGWAVVLLIYYDIVWRSFASMIWSPTKKTFHLPDQNKGKLWRGCTYCKPVSTKNVVNLGSWEFKTP